MKKNYFIMILLVGISLLVVSSCKKKGTNKKPWTHTKKRLDLVEPVPYCIEKKIQFMMKHNVEGDYTGIWRWTMKDGTIYYYIYNELSGCGDCGDRVYDENCNKICAPTGGFRGTGDGKCSDDIANFNYEEDVLLWKSFDF